MKHHVIFATAVALQLLTGCASTTQFSPEYSKQYVVKKDITIAADCRMFVDTASILFGQAKVPCFNGSTDGTTERIKIPAGSPMRVKRIFSAITKGAELEVQDESGRSLTAYFAYWPTSKEFYFTEEGK